MVVFLLISILLICAKTFTIYLVSFHIYNLKSYVLGLVLELDLESFHYSESRIPIANEFPS